MKKGCTTWENERFCKRKLPVSREFVFESALQVGFMNELAVEDREREIFVISFVGRVMMINIRRESSGKMSCRHWMLPKPKI